MGKMKELGLLDCEDRQSIEENFERMKKSGGGGDLLETVETEVPLNLVFDGNFDNYETVNVEKFVYVKVSDISDLTIEQLNGSTLTMIKNGTAMSGILDDRAFTDYAPMGAEMIVSPIDIYSDDGMSSVSTFALLVVYGDTSGMGVSFPTGIWFLFVSDSYYINSLTCPNATTTTTKTQLKPSLLPPHKHKWDDLEDAICYDRSVSEPLNLVFDGDFDNYETVDSGDNYFFVKLSDDVLAVDDVIGGTATMIIDGKENSFLITNETCLDLSSEGISALLIASEDVGECVLLVYETTDFEGVTLTPGVWFFYFTEKSYAKSLSNPNVTITTGELKKIDPKFYERPCYEEIDVLYSGTLTESIKAADGVYQYPIVKIVNGSPVGIEVPLTEGEIVKITINGVTEEKVVKKRTTSLSGVNTYYIGNEKFFINDGETVDTGESYCFSYDQPGPNPEPYPSIFSAAEKIDYQVELAGNKITPLPPKFMPELTQVILISPGGKKFKTTVDDTGQLVTTEA